MKKHILLLLMIIAVFAYSSAPKVIVFGMLDAFGAEFTNENIGEVTYKAWLESNPTEVIDSKDSLLNCSTMMFSELPIRGVSMVDLQHFTTWTAGDVLYVVMRDYNVGLKSSYYETTAVYLIEDTTPETVYRGFEDFFERWGIEIYEGSGMPSVMQVIYVPDPVTDIVTTFDSGNITLSWNSLLGVWWYNIYSSDKPYGTFNHVDTAPGESWQTEVTDDKKFYYVTAYYGSVGKTQPYTIEIKENK
ncbi:MAG: hypothetical protein PF638_01950 [Candidatus Delongbacteria bacterium]|nr:hypothetical protein [Candidatus Delongbacteria bacterium]